MSLSLIMTGLLYGVIALCIIGSVYKIITYLKTPVLFHTPLMPTSPYLSHNIFRFICEIFFFRSVYNADKLLWFLSLCFHYSLLLLFIWHLRYLFTLPTNIISFLDNTKLASSFFLIGSSSALLLRRCLQERIRYISCPADYLHLGLFLYSAGSGMIMMWYFPAINAEVLAAFSTATFFTVLPLPTQPLFLSHFFSALVLFALFPFSKLFHAVSQFFIPSRYQQDNQRAL